LSRTLPAICVAATLTAFFGAAELAAQKYSSRRTSFRTFMDTRTRQVPFKEVIQIEGSAAAGFVDDKGTSISPGEKDLETIDGSVWYHSESFTENNAVVDFYAGRDGGILSIQDTSPAFGSGQRLELFGRYTPFFREGFYENQEFVATGQYSGTDWGMYLGVGESPTEGVYFEAGPYFRVYEFDRTSRTSANYTLPDNFFSWGARLYLEQNTIALDRESGKPRQGYLLSIVVEREQNGSKKTFGVEPDYTTTLPEALWRARAKFESYLPLGFSTVELHAEANLSDEDDRIYNYDADRPGVGEFWIDSEARLRLDFGALEITPLAKLKYQQVRDRFGESLTDDVFWGGGLYIQYAFGDTFEIFADYSYSQDSNRPAISFIDDTLGQHQVFLGGRLRFGGERSF
jgi:hypothetical protein